MEHIIGGKFKLGRKIGSGSFGELYLGITFMAFLCLIYFFLSFLFYFFWCFCFAGVNVQSGEEVAVKLVMFGVLLFLPQFYFGFGRLFLFCAS